MHVLKIKYYYYSAVFTLLFRMSRYFRFDGSVGLVIPVFNNMTLRAPLYVCLRKPFGVLGSSSLYAKMTLDVPSYKSQKSRF